MIKVDGDWYIEPNNNNDEITYVRYENDKKYSFSVTKDLQENADFTYIVDEYANIDKDFILDLPSEFEKGEIKIIGECNIEVDKPIRYTGKINSISKFVGDLSLVATTDEKIIKNGKVYYACSTNFNLENNENLVVKLDNINVGTLTLSNNKNRNFAFADVGELKLENNKGSAKNHTTAFRNCYKGEYKDHDVISFNAHGSFEETPTTALFEGNVKVSHYSEIARNYNISGDNINLDGKKQGNFKEDNFLKKIYRKISGFLKSDDIKPLANFNNVIMKANGDINLSGDFDLSNVNLASKKDIDIHGMNGFNSKIKAKAIVGESTRLENTTVDVEKRLDLSGQTLKGVMLRGDKIGDTLFESFGAGISHEFKSNYGSLKIGKNSYRGDINTSSDFSVAIGNSELERLKLTLNQRSNDPKKVQILHTISSDTQIELNNQIIESSILRDVKIGQGVEVVSHSLIKNYECNEKIYDARSIEVIDGENIRANFDERVQDEIKGESVGKPETISEIKTESIAD